jgi:thioredoxin-like negative regulator of GroEL
MLNLSLRTFAMGSLAILPLSLAFSSFQLAHAQDNPSTSTIRWFLSQQPKPSSDSTGNAEGTDELDDLRPLNQSDSVLSPSGGQKLMDEAIQAVNGEKYDVAMEKLQQARKIFNQLSNFHLQLANSFSGIDQKVFEEQRSEALKTGQMRDEATYRLALVHRAKNQPELAVPLLIQIIRSQNPTTDLGKKSYQQLLELGFVATPFAPSNAGSTPPPAPK